MGKQSEAFVAGEGQQWLARNLAKLPVKNDPVLAEIEKIKIKPTFVLEIGCANGWRLLELRKRYGCVCDGIDPSVERYTSLDPFVHIWPGTADKLPPIGSGMMDSVIYGFCLYLCDPEDYFYIAAEGDRVLADDGHLIIYDFDSPQLPYARPYTHRNGLLSYHMDFSRLWLSHPAYHRVSSFSSGETRVTVLQKRMKSAFPVPHD